MVSGHHEEPPPFERVEVLILLCVLAFSCCFLCWPWSWFCSQQCLFCFSAPPLYVNYSAPCPILLRPIQHHSLQNLLYLPTHQQPSPPPSPPHRQSTPTPSAVSMHVLPPFYGCCFLEFSTILLGSPHFACAFVLFPPSAILVCFCALLLSLFLLRFLVPLPISAAL